MRRRRRKRRIKDLESVYKQENLQITSKVPLNDEQLNKICSKINDTINRLSEKPSYEVAKQLIVQHKGLVRSVIIDFDTGCYGITVDSSYLDSRD